ncbi:MAG: chemotaxis protein CheD [Thermoplasmata archaeon]|nr:MAG: chemotaxis protein CheD [Thermoplasmata archaeon]
MNTINVGIAEAKAAKNPTTLVTIGLGSCIGIALYDAKLKVGALVHVMLPSSKEAADSSNPAKFADTAIPYALDLLKKYGTSPRRLTAKIAGGANMFSFTSQNPIGERNIKAVKEALRKHGIKIVGEDVGGNVGRTMKFDLTTGKVIIRTSKGEKEI